MREDAERERLRRQQEFEDKMRKKKDEMQILNQKEELNNKLNEIKMKEEQLRFQQNMILHSFHSKYRRYNPLYNYNLYCE